MKKILFGLIILTACSILITSCNKEDSADVNQDTIYTVYELWYNANTDKTVAIARLRFGSATGTLLEAKAPAGVTFNGDVLPYSVLYSGHAKEYSGKINAGTFVYTNTQQLVYTNSTPTMNTIGHPSTLDTIVKSQANNYVWNGNALGANERANLFVGSWTWGQDALFFATSGQTDIVMGVQQLANLALGTSTLYVDRVNEVGLVQPTPEGGVIRTRYRPLNTQVEVVP